jgi:hypothetical protein
MPVAPLIYSFKLTHISINSLATVFSGIATVTVKDGPHIDSIQLLEQLRLRVVVYMNIKSELSCSTFWWDVSDIDVIYTMLRSRL